MRIGWLEKKRKIDKKKESDHVAGGARCGVGGPLFEQLDSVSKKKDKGAGVAMGRQKKTKRMRPMCDVGGASPLSAVRAIREIRPVPPVPFPIATNAVYGQTKRQRRGAIKTAEPLPLSRGARPTENADTLAGRDRSASNFFPKKH